MLHAEASMLLPADEFNERILDRYVVTHYKSSRKKIVLYYYGKQ